MQARASKTTDTAVANPFLSRDPGRFAVPGPDRLPISWPLIYVLSALVLAVWLTPQSNFLELNANAMPVSVHTLLELIAVVVALLAFAVAWHAHDDRRPSNILILGCGLLAVGVIDVAHLMSYQGMPDWVTPASTEKAIDFWLCARYTAALTLLAIACREWKPVHARGRYLLLLAAMGWSTLTWGLGLFAPDFWPRTFIEGQGLTAFKIGAECALIALLLIPALLFYRQQGSNAHAYDSSGLFVATVVTILSELCFTLYTNVNGVFMLLGHSYKIIAFLFIYRAVFVVSVREPYKRLEQEIAERSRAEAEIHHRVYHDPLTELPNRLMMEEQVQAAFSRERGMALIAADIDHFQSLNDVLGIAVGDDLLRQVAHRLLAACGECCLVSRLSGDAWLILLEGVQHEAEVEPVLRSIMTAMEGPFTCAGQQMHFSLSAGVALAPRDGRDFEMLRRNADTAMHRAKHAGRQTWRFFNLEMDAREQERIGLFGSLREAIDTGQFRIHYQPQVDVNAMQVTGVEALLRWEHPQMGRVAPDRFVHIAEETGLIVEIGHWVLMQACQQMKDWRQAGMPRLTLAVNVSAAQFHNGALARSVEMALASSGLEAADLELEMTETVLMHDSEVVLDSVRKLRGLGVRVAIDDFGTGYSSLSYLKRFAVSRLKIDRSFVSDLTTDPDDATIVRAIIDLARSLRLAVLAEGVEDIATLNALRELGCDEAQGFMFSAPLPPEQIPDFVSRAGSRQAA